MLRKFQIIGIAGALIFSALVLTDSLPSNSPPLPAPTIDTAEILVTNLDKPWAIAFADERIFVSEKSGKIHVVTPSGKLDSPLISLRTPEIFGGGLLGITTHPDFENNHYLYAYYTYEENENLWNKVIRITEENSISVEVITILDKIQLPTPSKNLIKKIPNEKLKIVK